MVTEILPSDPVWESHARARLEGLRGGAAAQGRLAEIACRLAGIQGSARPTVNKRRIYVAAADHGVALDAAITVLPREATRQAAEALAAADPWPGVERIVLDAGLELDSESLRSVKLARGTESFGSAAAMSADQALRAVSVGIQLAAESARDGVNLLGCGTLGVGASASASTITTVLTGRVARFITDREDGIDDEALQRKNTLIEQALQRLELSRRDPMVVMQRVGGYEMAVVMGLLLGAAAHRIALVADGFPAVAACALAVTVSPPARDFLFVADRGPQPGMAKLLESFELAPLLDLGTSRQDGLAAAMGMLVVEGAVRLLDDTTQNV